MKWSGSQLKLDDRLIDIPIFIEGGRINPEHLKVAQEIAAQAARDREQQEPKEE